MHPLGLEAPTVVRSFFGGDTEHLTREATDSATRQLFQSLAGLDLSAVPIDGIVEAGIAGPTIATYSEEHEVDLLVIGDRGSGLLQRVLFGSTASHLLRTSPAPVLVVKSAPDRPYRDVLIAVDFSPACSGSIRLAQTLAPDARGPRPHGVGERLPTPAARRIANDHAGHVRRRRDPPGPRRRRRRRTATS